VEKYQHPCTSHCLLKLPPHFESLPKFPSKRSKVNRRGTYNSTSQNCDYPTMSTKLSLKDTGSPSTPIPYVVNGIPLTPLAATGLVTKVLVLTPTQPVVYTRPILTNPFGSLFGMSGYNYYLIPSDSNPFSFVCPI
jgi:hypothetical protein